MRATRSLAFIVAALSGTALGWYVAGRHLERHKADLFSANRFRRLAALSYLAGEDGVATLQLLRDYIAWEPTAPLRQRASRMLRRMEAQLA